MRQDHPLLSKAGWVRLTIVTILALVGILIQFDVTIKQEVSPDGIKVVQVSETELIKKDGKISRRACVGLEKHKGEKKRHFLDTFGLPEGYDNYGNLTYQIRGEEVYEVCTLDFDFKNKLQGVSMYLWYDENKYGPFE